MEFPRECERRFLCPLSGRRGSLLSRNGLNYGVGTEVISVARGGLGSELMGSTYTVLAQGELLFLRLVVLVCNKR